MFELTRLTEIQFQRAKLNENEYKLAANEYKTIANQYKHITPRKINIYDPRAGRRGSINLPFSDPLEQFHLIHPTKIPTNAQSVPTTSRMRNYR